MKSMLKIDYHNLRLATWEPMVEQWHSQVKVHVHNVLIYLPDRAFHVPQTSGQCEVFRENQCQHNQ